jgi:hypothetical protein
MSKKHVKFTETGLYKGLLTTVGCVLTMLVIVFSVLTFAKAKAGQLEEAPKFMVWTFICLGFTRFVSYLKNRSKMSLTRAIVLLIVDVGLGVLVIFAKYNPYIFSVTAGLFAASIVISRIFKLIEKHSTRDIIFNAIIILAAIGLAIGFFQKVNEDTLGAIILGECLFIAICTFIEASLLSFSQLKLDIFAKIIFRTYAIEIIFGLFALMVAFSLILMLEEPTMHNFPDALWYCFTLVTTIGFGDFAAETLIGRVLSVILGIYGIVVVAVLTSIVVNFYNETSKDTSKEFKQIEKEHKK